MKVNSSFDEDFGGKKVVLVRKADSVEYCRYPMRIPAVEDAVVGDDVLGHVACHPTRGSDGWISSQSSREVEKLR